MSVDWESVFCLHEFQFEICQHLPLVHIMKLSELNKIINMKLRYNMELWRKMCQGIECSYDYFSSQIKYYPEKTPRDIFLAMDIPCPGFYVGLHPFTEIEYTKCFYNI